MPWGRVDDTYYDHPKLEELDDARVWPDRLAAAGLNTLAWSWCNRFLTDGKVPRTTVTKLGGTTELADMLVSVGLWEESAGGYRIHDFLVYNDSREQVLARRDKEAARKAAYRAGKRPAGSPNGTPSTNDEPVPPGVPAGVPVGQDPVSRAESQRVSRDSSRAGIPTRPDPSRPNEEKVARSLSSQARAADDEATLLTKGQLDAWTSFGPEWDATKAAWLARGFKHPPAGEPDGDDTSQRGILWSILDSRPSDLPRWIREAKGKTAAEVVAHVIARWHEVRAEVEDDADDEVAWLREAPRSRTATPEPAGAIAARLVEQRAER